MIQTERGLNYPFSILARCPKTSDVPGKMQIPDTLYYQHGSLRLWYYTDDCGEVLKRDKKDCVTDRILDYFCPDVPEDSTLPVAMYLHYHGKHCNVKGVEDDASIVMAIDFASQFSGDAEPISIDYFDRAALVTFLGTRENKHNVIVQKFVMNTSRHFAITQVIWSPYKTVILPRQNNNNVFDERIPLQQRCQVDESSPFSREMKSTPRMVERLTDECKKIVDHVFLIEQQPVVRMIVFFAFDKLKRPNFLWASEMQMTTQPISVTEVKKGLEFQVKRNLMQISPSVVPSDIYVPASALKKATATMSSTSAHRSPIKVNTNLASILHHEGNIDKVLDILDNNFETSRRSIQSHRALKGEALWKNEGDISLTLATVKGNGSSRLDSLHQGKHNYTRPTSALCIGNQPYNVQVVTNTPVHYSSGGGGGFFRVKGNGSKLRVSEHLLLTNHEQPQSSGNKIAPSSSSSSEVVMGGRNSITRIEFNDRDESTMSLFKVHHCHRFSNTENEFLRSSDEDSCKKRMTIDLWNYFLPSWKERYHNIQKCYDEVFFFIDELTGRMDSECCGFYGNISTNVQVMADLSCVHSVFHQSLKEALSIANMTAEHGGEERRRSSTNKTKISSSSSTVLSLRLKNESTFRLLLRTLQMFHSSLMASLLYLKLDILQALGDELQAAIDVTMKSNAAEATGGGKAWGQNRAWCRPCKIKCSRRSKRCQIKE